MKKNTYTLYSIKRIGRRVNRKRIAQYNLYNTAVNEARKVRGETEIVDIMGNVTVPNQLIPYKPNRF